MHSEITARARWCVGALLDFRNGSIVTLSRCPRNVGLCSDYGHIAALRRTTFRAMTSRQLDAETALGEGAKSVRHVTSWVKRLHARAPRYVRSCLLIGSHERFPPGAAFGCGTRTGDEPAHGSAARFQTSPKHVRCASDRYRNGAPRRASKGRLAGPRIFWPNVAEIMSRSAGSSTFCARASTSRNEPNWVIGRKAAQRLRREAISASLSERHGRNGAVDLGLRPEGDGPGR